MGFEMRRAAGKVERRTLSCLATLYRGLVPLDQPRASPRASEHMADLLFNVRSSWATKTENLQTLKLASALARRWDDPVPSYFSRFATVPPANNDPSPMVKIKSPHKECSRAAHMTDRLFKYVVAKSSPPAAERTGAQTLPNTM